MEMEGLLYRLMANIKKAAVSTVNCPQSHVQKGQQLVAAATWWCNNNDTASTYDGPTSTVTEGSRAPMRGRGLQQQCQ